MTDWILLTGLVLWGSWQEWKREEAERELREARAARDAFKGALLDPPRPIRSHAGDVRYGEVKSDE